MVHHTVFFKIQPQTSVERIDLMIDKLNSLKSIETVNQILIAKNFSERSKGYSVILYSSFDAKEDLDIYINHPKHIEVVDTFVKPILEDLIVGDIEE